MYKEGQCPQDAQTQPIDGGTLSITGTEQIRTGGLQIRGTRNWTAKKINQSPGATVNEELYRQNWEEHRPPENK